MVITEIDSLQISIQANADSANRSISALANQLVKLKGALSGINTGALRSLSTSLGTLGNSMKAMSGFTMPDFNRVAKGINKLSTVNTGNLASAAASIQRMGNALSGMNGMEQSAKNLASLSSAIAKLGYKSTTNAITNMPQLASAFKNLMATLSTAPRVSQNVIDLANAMANLSRSGASVGTVTTKASKGLNLFHTSSKRAAKSGTSLAAVIGKVYATYWLLFRLFSKLGDAIDISSDLTEVQNVVDVTFGNMSDKMEKFVQNSIKAYGMSELTAKTIASRFQAMGTAMDISNSSVLEATKFLSGLPGAYGEVSDSISGLSLNLTRLTADMASFYNLEQADVAEDLEAIYTGMTRPLRKYGLDLTQATLAEWALRNGLNADIESMTQAEKTMLRYQYVMSNMQAAMGDFTRTSDTWANQTRILKQQFEQLAAVIGEGLIYALKPFVQSMNNAMASVISAVQSTLNALGKIFGWQIEIQDVGVTNALADSLEDVTDGYDSATGAAKKLKTVTLGIDELNINDPGNDSSGGGGGASATSDLAALGTDEYGIKMEETIGLFESSIDTLEELGEKIGDKLSNLMAGIDWHKSFEKAKGFGKGLADFLNGLISPELFGNFGKTVANALNSAINASFSFGNTFDFKELGASLGEGLDKALNTFNFSMLSKTISKWVNGIFDGILAFFDKLNPSKYGKRIADFINSTISSIKWKNIGKAITEGISIALDFTISLLDSLDWFALGESIGDFIVSIDFGKILSKVGEAIWLALSGAFKAAAGLFDTAPIETVLASLAGVIALSPSGSAIKASFGTLFAGGAELFVVSDAVKSIALNTENLGTKVAGLVGSVGLAAAAFTKAFGFPTGLIVTGIVGVVGAINGLYKALDAQEILSYGEVIYNALSNPGGVSLGELTDNFANKVNEAVTSAYGSVDELRNKVASIEQSKESVDRTAQSIQSIGLSISNGAYTVEEKKEEILASFESLVSETESLLSQEYDIIIQNLVGAMADAITAQGGSVPEYMSNLLKLKDDTTSAAYEIKTDMEALQKAYDVGAISVDTYTNNLMKYSAQLSAITQGNVLEETAIKLDQFGKALDLSEYMGSDGTFDIVAFANEFGIAVTSIETAQANINESSTAFTETMAQFQASCKAAVEQGLIPLEEYEAVDWDALFNGDQAAREQALLNLEGTFTDYANIIQYNVAEQLPKVIQTAIENNQNVSEAIAVWKENVVDPIAGELESGFNQLGIDAEPWVQGTVTTMAESLNDFADGTTTFHLDEAWKGAIQGDLERLAENLDISGFGTEIVTGFNNGISDSAEATTGVINNWFAGIDTSIHDNPSMPFGSPNKKTYEYGQDMVRGFGNGLIDEEANEELSANVELFFTNLSAKFSIERFTEVFGNMKTGLQNVWSEVLTWFDETFLPEMDSKNVEVQLKFDTIYSTIADGVKGYLQQISDKASEVFSTIATGIRDVSENLSKLNQALSDIGSKKIDVDVSGISGYASGGFVSSASLFYAGENGVPEMLGTVGGKTAVAGGSEITGIREQVYESGNAQAQLLSTAVGLLQEIAQKDISVDLDGRELINGINKRSARNGWSFT